MYDLRQFCEFHEKLLVLLLYDYENWSCDGDDLMYILQKKKNYNLFKLESNQIEIFADLKGNIHHKIRISHKRCKSRLMYDRQHSIHFFSF